MSARGRADLARTAGLVLFAALAIAAVRAPLFDRHQQIKETSDVYVLPPPRQVVAMSLGYRAALADVLWAHLLVTQGLRTMDRRRYENVVPQIDAINELDPTFRDPYRLADALVTLNVKAAPIEDVRRTREILERGLKNRPLDAELWLVAGEFVAFIAPASYLTDPVEQQQWRVDGAMMMVRAAELSGNNSAIAWHALGGARYLSKAGARDAEIRFLERTMVVTDDEDLKNKVRARLDQLLGSQRLERFGQLEKGVWDMRHDDLPFVSRLRFMVLGPPRDPSYCAGEKHAHEPACAPTFREWEARTFADKPR